MSKEKFGELGIPGEKGLTIQFDGQDALRIDYVVIEGELKLFTRRNPNDVEEKGAYTTMEEVVEHTIEEINDFLNSGPFYRFIWEAALQSFHQSVKWGIEDFETVVEHDEWESLDSRDIGEAGTAVLQALLSADGLGGLRSALWEHLRDFFEERA